MSKLYCIIEIMLLTFKKINENKKKQRIKRKNKTNKQATTKQTKTATTYNSPCLHYRWRCYQAIALNDQQVGPTSLALLSP